MREFQRVTAIVIGMAALNIAPAGAQGLVTAPRISAALANEAVGAAVASCAAQGYHETAVLVDTDGVTQASLRGDETGIHTLDSAHDKAYTAVSFKRDTMEMKPGETDVLMARLPHLLRAGGGVVIKSGTTVLGAIGASGA
ncbi:MAG TPA: heme-binding protein, partial [Rhizomicrobium sp.]|nr:heme-binding protein [Rhizomicrobium sp.]